MNSFKEKIKQMECSLSFDDFLIKPALSEILPADVDLSLKLDNKLTLNLPIFSAAMDTVTEYEMSKAMISSGACGILHKNVSISQNIEAIKKLKEEFDDTKPIGVAVGTSNTEEEIENLVKAGANIIVVDCAHGHSKNVGDLVSHISKNYPNVYLIAGNVVTEEGAKYLIDRGAKAIKVGMGCGSICTTRKVTGIGRGQVTSIAEVADYCHKNNTLVIADGGIRATDDIVKAIAVGADAVMLGYMLSGCDECPGDIVEIEGEKYKYYRGMGSKGVMKSNDKHLLATCKWIAEGVESYVKIKGSTKDVLFDIEWSLKAAFGYIGAKNLKEAQTKTNITRTTGSVLSRTNFHSIDKLIKN